MKYIIDHVIRKRLDDTFTYHPPKDDQAERYVEIRSKARELAETFVGNVPASRELSLAMTKLEEAVMHANAGIARNE